jgi:hypothetical protein
MIGRLAIERGGRVETIDLDEYGAGAIVDAAAGRANEWIKALRRVDLGGRSLRDRFHYRGDSLWWFAELFLHKEGVIDGLFRAALTLEAICETEQPSSMALVDGGTAAAHLLPQVAARYQIPLRPGSVHQAAAIPRDAQTREKGALLTWAARLRHALPLGRPPALAPGGTLAFVHSAFWREATAEEGYIAPVLDALDATLARPIQLVGLGPRRNFQARRWWHTLAPSWRVPLGDGAVVPVETISSQTDRFEWDKVWAARHATAKVLTESPAMRAAAAIAGYDAWQLVAPELRGIATLQFPWSARAMDEAGAAMDRLAPRLVLTYAEAGGWGRAIMLEARRRGIPTAGLQHGFIYRRWLNYLHEADEMAPSPRVDTDRGFPRPDLTLLFDHFASQHLERAGHFPPASLLVTGSPGLDRLAERMKAIGPEARAAARVTLGLTGADRAALVVAKRAQLGRWLPLLVAAVQAIDGRGARGRTRLVIRPHPAETADVYGDAIASTQSTSLAPPALDLATLLVAADLLVTVNSTVAIDAMALGLPALAVGMPNNLTPIVVEGGIAGVYHPSELEEALERLLWDDGARGDQIARGRACASAGGMRADGLAASRSASALAGLAAPARVRPL